MIEPGGRELPRRAVPKEGWVTYPISDRWYVFFNGNRIVGPFTNERIALREGKTYSKDIRSYRLSKKERMQSHIDALRHGREWENIVAVTLRRTFKDARATKTKQHRSGKPDVEGTPFWIDCVASKTVDIVTLLSQAAKKSDGRPVLVIVRTGSRSGRVLAQSETLHKRELKIVQRLIENVDSETEMATL